MNHENQPEGQGTLGSSLLIFLSGVAIGAAVAMLYAPQAGIDTRARIAEKTGEIKDKVSDFTTQVADKASGLKDKLSSQARDTMSKTADALDRGADTMRETSAASA